MQVLNCNRILILFKRTKIWYAFGLRCNYHISGTYAHGIGKLSARFPTVRNIRRSTKTPHMILVRAPATFFDYEFSAHFIFPFVLVYRDYALLLYLGQSSYFYERIEKFNTRIY